MGKGLGYGRVQDRFKCSLQCMWRRQGERYLAITTTPVSFGRGSIMTRGDVSFDARIELNVNNALTATRYIQNILQKHIVPFGALITYDQFI